MSLGIIPSHQLKWVKGCSDREAFYYLSIHADKNMFMFSFEFPLSVWVLKFIIYIKVKMLFVMRRKIKLPERLVLCVSLLPELFWNGCFLSGSVVCLLWGFVFFSYLISVLVCTMWYQETDGLSSPILWESSREKDFLYYVSWSSYWLSKRMMFRQSNNVLIIWLPATICTLARIWILILLVWFCEML